MIFSNKFPQELRKETSPRISRITEKYLSGPFKKFSRNFENAAWSNGIGDLPGTIKVHIQQVEEMYSKNGVYKENAKSLRKDEDQYKQELQAHLESIVHESDFFKRISTEGLGDVLNKSGRFKSQVETGKSSGGSYLGPGVKADTDTNMFGFPKNGDVSKRPVYGYFSNDENGAVTGDGVSGYGSIIVKFKRGRILPKTTITFGDSYNGFKSDNVGYSSFVPSPAMAPHFTSVFAGSIGEKRTRHDLREPLRLPVSSKPLLNTIDKPTYYEAQYHGGIGRDDIESIYIRKEDWENNLDLRNTINTFKENNKKSKITIVIF